MAKSRILLVEDETDVRDLMLLHLTREGYSTTAVDNGEEAEKLLEKDTYDLAILDWMLPGLSGMELCKRVQGKLPVLMVTARADTADVVLGLEMGADDYVTKPFEIPVFVARVRALLRRKQIKLENASGVKRFTAGDLMVDLEKHAVRFKGDALHLTPSEFKLLATLMEHRGKVLSRDKLIDAVQGVGVAVVDRAIDTHVFGLRKKLGPAASEVIETIRGVGYRVKDEV